MGENVWFIQISSLFIIFIQARGTTRYNSKSSYFLDKGETITVNLFVKSYKILQTNWRFLS